MEKANTKLSLREMQTECAKALSTMQATNNNIYQFNKVAHHNSHTWYLTVIQWYIDCLLYTSPSPRDS